jgi:hypothetical protein
MNYIVAIPSYKRADTLVKKSLKVLYDECIPPEIIYIFVVEEEYEAYKLALPEELRDNIIVGRHSLREQRFFIQEYFPVGQRIVFMDDDISQIKRLGSSFYDPPEGLSKIFENFFIFSDLKGCKLWGVYPASNYMFMKTKALKGLFYSIGSLYGIVNNKDIHAPTCCKEDYYTSIFCYIRDGGIMRFCGLSPVSSYWKGTGGMNAYRTIQNEKEASENLLALYTDYISKLVLKKNGRWDIVLNKMPKEQFELIENPLLESHSEVA